MRVKDLIKELKKQDKEAIVVWSDHDHSGDEYNNFVYSVNEASDKLKKEGIGVVIRP